MPDNTEQLKERLNSFDRSERAAALKKLVATGIAGAVPEGSNVNMHFHSFFSYNPENWSPSRIAWESKTRGLYATGLCDFDVLDGLDEFHAAAEALSLRATVNLETRAYLAEFADKEINSPGEPGVTYIMGAGFPAVPADGTVLNEGLKEYRRRAGDRNRALIERVNAELAEIAIDYENDVLPLTPSGSATERHIVTAYIKKAADTFNGAKLAEFWAGLFGKSVEETREIVENPLKLEDIARARLAKRGGIGYVQPSVDTFPSVDDFISWVVSCDAVPMIAWLDGTSDGESDPEAMLECLVAKGAAALNIIPDRNWNYPDPAAKALKSAKLAEMVAAADSMNLPINIGTEMNKAGQPFVDDLDGEVLKAHKRIFIKGARVMVGHSVLARFADFPYAGAKASAEFADRAAMNDFFEAVGALPPLSAEFADELRSMGTEKAFAELAEKAR